MIHTISAILLKLGRNASYVNPLDKGNCIQVNMNMTAKYVTYLLAIIGNYFPVRALYAYSNLCRLPDTFGV